eukprot:Skav214510  [mRNA]  locus=scaffold1011:400157:401172:+ [translate_table: standard]
MYILSLESPAKRGSFQSNLSSFLSVNLILLFNVFFGVRIRYVRCIFGHHTLFPETSLVVIPLFQCRRKQLIHRAAMVRHPMLVLIHVRRFVPVSRAQQAVGKSRPHGMPGIDEICG